MIVVLLEIYSDIYLISRFDVSSSYHQLPHFISTAQQNIAQEESLFGLQTDTLTHQGFKQRGLGLGCPSQEFRNFQCNVYTSNLSTIGQKGHVYNYID